jgi:hypothetical protein
MRNPSWFSRRYPDLSDLVGFAWEMRAVVVYGPIDEAGIVLMEPPAFTTICMPEGLGPLAQRWQLAHELGHLALHHGYTTPFAHDKQEAQACRWAARALIPAAAIRRHQNASVDAFIAALSAHHEEIPLVDCPQRRLAAEIALIRLGAVEEVG